MKKRITMEIEKRWLGKLEHHVEFDPEEEQDGLDMYKGLDVYVVSINDREPKTNEKFDKILEERRVLVRTLTDGVTKFEHDQTMLDFCNHAEFNLYESSNDEDNANKQNESDNQKEEQNKEDIDKGIEEDSSKGTEESGSEGTEESGTDGIKEDESEGKDDEK
ncbi:hypothetical protein Tco_1232364 [Tanacetum coccineum]